MKRIALLTFSVLLVLAACRDQPTAPVAEGPSFAAVHGEGVPAPRLFYQLSGVGDLQVRWTWSDDQEWDLVSFELVFDGRKVEGEWNIKPYAADAPDLYPFRSFSWTRPGHGETVPDLCVSVMAKNRSGRGVPTRTYHAENCAPVLQPLVGSTPVLRKETISAGLWHSCGLSISGEAYCWGFGLYGQLGGGQWDYYRYTPRPAAGGLVFNQISAGNDHTCALTPSGQAYCWGYNYQWQVGDGSMSQTNRYGPTAVAGGHTFRQISAGGEHTCGVTTSGAAYCWGDNGAGQLGNNTFSYAPRPVVGEFAFTQVDAGVDHTCALTPSGAAHCWGWNSDGQLGDGTTSGGWGTSPGAVAGGLAFSQIDAAKLTPVP
jgi:hypothetical protein